MTIKRPHSPGPIVAATDFSAPAEVALRWAKAVAAAGEIPLHVAHVIPIPPGMSDPTTMTLPSAIEQLEGAARRDLEALARRERQAGVALSTHLRIGSPAVQLDLLAQELGAALLVVGTRGLTGLRSLLLGSTARRALSHAPCPVLAVHPEEREPRLPLRRLLLATDFSFDDDRTLELAARLLGFAQGESRLLMIHVVAVPGEYVHFAREASPASLDLAAISTELGAQLEARAATLRRAGWSVESRLCHGGAIAAQIVREGKLWGADLVAVRTHGRSAVGRLLLGSVAERLVQLAESPVLVVPADGD